MQSGSDQNILGALQKQKIIFVARSIGGARLVRSPMDLTAWEVYHTVEPNGLKGLLEFHPNPSLECPVGKHIKSVLEKTYQKVGVTVQETMEKITLQQLLDDYHRTIADGY